MAEPAVRALASRLAVVERARRLVLVRLALARLFVRRIRLRLRFALAGSSRWSLFMRCAIPRTTSPAHRRRDHVCHCGLGELGLLLRRVDLVVDEHMHHLLAAQDSLPQSSPLPDLIHPMGTELKVGPLREVELHTQSSRAEDDILLEMRAIKVEMHRVDPGAVWSHLHAHEVFTDEE